MPALLILTVKGEKVHDELVDLAQSQHFRARILYGHGNERNVGIGRLGMGVGPSVSFRVRADPGQGRGRDGIGTVKTGIRPGSGPGTGIRCSTHGAGIFRAGGTTPTVVGCR